MVHFELRGKFMYAAFIYVLLFIEWILDTTEVVVNKCGIIYIYRIWTVSKTAQDKCLIY